MARFFTSLLLFFSSLSFAGDVEDIQADTLLSDDNRDWLIIDVRSAEEYAEGHVPGAINIAHSEIADKLDQIIGHKDKPVVVYCRSGYRASKAAKVLTSNQFSKVKHLAGDMSGWIEAGHPVEQ